MARDNATGSMGWWSDDDVQDPPYIEQEPGQIGQCLDHYAASKVGFASGEWPDGTDVAAGGKDEVPVPRQTL
jgi:hypothetical protein